MSEVIQWVFLDRDNHVSMKFSYLDSSGDEQDLDLSGLNDVELIIHESNAGADYSAKYSDGVPMTWDSFGNLNIWLGDLAIDQGDFLATLIFYDVAHADGQVVISQNGLNTLLLRITNV